MKTETKIILTIDFLSIAIAAIVTIFRAPIPFWWAGWILMPLGMGLRLLAIKTLGPDFFIDIQRPARVVRTGVYSVLRHPAYVGTGLLFIGFGLVLNNLISLCVCAVPVIFLVRRARTEERILHE